MNIPELGWLAMGTTLLAVLFVAVAFDTPKVSRVEANLDAQLNPRDELAAHYEQAQATSFFERIVLPVLKRANTPKGGNGVLFKSFRGKNTGKLGDYLKIADYPWGLSLNEFQLLQMTAGGAFALLGLVLAIVIRSPLLFLVAIVLAALGYKYPETVVQKKAQAKQKAVLDQYQSVCDMLALASDAGLGVLDTLHRVASQLKGRLSEELMQTLLDIQYGMSEEAAFTELASRCGVEEIDVFVQNILQSRRLGTPTAEVFHRLAEQSRTQAANRAEAQSQKLTVKLIPVIAVFIFLPLIGIIGGPAIFSIHASGF